MQRGAVAGDDEEHVVDPDADADHRGHLRREVGHLEHVGQQRDEAQADAEADDRDEDRQAHGQQRAEADEQDQRRHQEADALGAELGLLGTAEREAGQLDLQVRAIDLLAQGDERLRVRVLVVGDGLVEAKRAVGDGAPRRDLAGALRRERRDHRAHVGLLAELVEDVADRRLHGRVVDGLALLRLEHDVDVVAGRAANPLFEQVLRLLGVRAGRGEREVVVATEGARAEDGGDQQDDPQQQHPSPAAVGPVGETDEQRRAGRRGAPGRRHSHRMGSSGRCFGSREYGRRGGTGLIGGRGREGGPGRAPLSNGGGG